MAEDRRGGAKALGIPHVLFVGERAGLEWDVEACLGRTYLVRRNQQLLSFGAEGHELFYFQGGEGVAFDVQEQVVSSLVWGYPQFTVNRDGTEITISLSVSRLFTVSNDKMFVTMNFFPGEGEGIDIDGLVVALREEGITAGIDRVAIAEAVERCDRGETVQNVLVARGTLPLHGKDAWFRFEVETGPCAGTILGNGKIDFRERKVFTGVEKEQLIAVKVPLTEGTPGCTVHGEKIAARPGKDIKVSVSGDVAYNPESHEVRALCAGILSVTNNTAIKVQAKQVLAGDVDYQTGNVKSGDSVEINGTIKPGFTVIAKGDVVVGGNVCDAKIQCRANAVIKGGLVGKKGLVKARGDVDIGFVEHGSLQAGGTVLLRKDAYYSHIRAAMAIHCAETGRIIGSHLLCGKDISCGVVGSGKAAPMTLAAGIDLTRFDILQGLHARAAELHAQLTLFLQHRGEVGRGHRKYLRLDSEMEALKRRLDHFNLITGTEEDSLLKPSMNICEATITVHGDIAIGTTIRIGNVVLCVTRNFRSVRFALDEMYRQIEMVPL